MPPEIVIAIVVWVNIYVALPFVVRPKFKKLPGSLNGRNHLFYIHIDPEAPHRLAVVAHELAEWKYRYRRPWLWFKWISDAQNREINLWGPAVETAYAVQFYREDEDEFIAKEARALARRDYFSSDVGRIERQIKRRMPEARAWVSKNLEQVQAVKE